MEQKIEFVWVEYFKNFSKQVQEKTSEMNKQGFKLTAVAMSQDNYYTGMLVFTKE